jgi:hypothetical protein
VKTNFQHLPASRAAAGFTLAELMIASGLLVMLTTAIVCTFIFGLQLHQTTEVKLGSNDDARKAVISLTDEIRSATQIQVGTGNALGFTQAATNTAQTGAAVQIYPTSDTNSWVRYYSEADPTSTNYGRLCRIGSTDGSNYVVVVPHNLVNLQSLFSSEDSYGNALTNNQNNRVISLNLQLYALEYPATQIGSSQSHDFYQLHTRITRRLL